MSTQTLAGSSAAVRGFGELSRADVPFAGGKGANLGELSAAGLPVPPGFVVGAPAYAAFVDESGLRERIAASLEDVDVDDMAALEAACAEVRTRDRGHARARAPQDRDRRAPTRPSVTGNAAVAVRSSATAEDTASASFAGMNETFLNVSGARRRHRRRPPLLGLAVRRAHRLLPREARTRPGRHGHRRGRPAPDPVHSRRGHVHDRSLHRSRRPAGHRGVLRAR